jgi:hypothetical protein
MPTPTVERHDLLTIITCMPAKPGKESELRDALQVPINPTQGARIRDL